ncbi:hypothetical protein MTO96_010789 [Rhipicephalus appendiculatus]
MAEPATFHYQGTRTQSSRSRICGRVLGTAVGLVLGSFLLVLIGMIASMDVFMPSNGMYRNVSHTNMGVLETMITLAVKNIADRYWNSGNHDEAARRTTDRSRSSMLLIRNRSLAFHEELRGQMGEQLCARRWQRLGRFNYADHRGSRSENDGQSGLREPQSFVERGA